MVQLGLERLGDRADLLGALDQRDRIAGLDRERARRGRRDLEALRAAQHAEVVGAGGHRHVDEQQVVEAVEVGGVDVAVEAGVAAADEEVQVGDRLEQTVAGLGRVERGRDVELLGVADEDRALREGVPAIGPSASGASILKAPA